MNAWYKFIKENFPQQYEKMQKYGRRNVSFSTVAPTGTVSIMAQVSSGIEPIFAPYYERSKKCMSENDRVDFTDITGEKFTKFYVLHEPFKQWIQLKYDDGCEGIKTFELEDYFKKSPWYNSDSASIDWEDRIELQSIVQKYTTHSISSTINLPKDVKEETISQIFMMAWNKNLKGITIYRDGCRDGILNNITTEEKLGTIKENSAPKRPKTLPAEMYVVKSQGISYAVIVGLLDGKPFEIFAYELKKDSLGEKLAKNTIGTITKVKKGQYQFNSEFYVYPNLQLANDKIEEKACTIYTSMLLRHGAAISFIIDTTRKINDNITSFSSAMCRVLGKYIPKEEVKGEVCPDCGKPLVHEAGCVKCSECTYSKCFFIHQSLT
jgi:ribonucleoside-diphosphate reductase alpha chain